MARKLHLAVMTRAELETHRRWVLAEQAAVLAELALRDECDRVDLEAQVKIVDITTGAQLSLDDIEDVRIVARMRTMAGF